MPEIPEFATGPIEGIGGTSRYHSRNGLYFDKRDAGYVRICYAPSGMADETPKFICELSPSEWASVVAFVSEAGENTQTHGEAMALHLGIG